MSTGVVASPSRRIHLVATPGGHLDLLMALASAVEEFPRTWVVSPGPSARALADAGEDVQLLPRFHGFSARNVALAVRSVAPVLRDRPRLVVTAGSGSVVPYCVLARALGATVVFTETMARVTNSSSGGRVFSRLASSVLVQWPEMLDVYPGAHACRPALLEEVGAAPVPREARSGTLVAVGTHIDPFDRLLATVDDAVRRGVLPEPVVAQTGVCEQVPAGFDARAWLSPDEMDAAVAAARYMVCHAGSGLIARALRSGLTPLVLPRLARHGEHVDDHQAQITAKLGELGLVIPLEGAIETEHVRAADAGRPAMHRLADLPTMASCLAGEVRRLLDERGAQPLARRALGRMRARSSRRVKLRNSGSST